MLWRLAGWPTRTCPSSVNATIDGVVRPPSAFSITLALFPSITATQELVVPRSIPIAFAMSGLLVSRRARIASTPGSDRASGLSWFRFKLSAIAQMRDAQGASRETANASRNRLRGSSGFLGFAGFLDLDLLRLGFGRLRNHDLEDSVRHGCLYA